MQQFLFWTGISSKTTNNLCYFHFDSWKKFTKIASIWQGSCVLAKYVVQNLMNFFFFCAKISFVTYFVQIREFNTTKKKIKKTSIRWQCAFRHGLLGLQYTERVSSQYTFLILSFVSPFFHFSEHDAVNLFFCAYYARLNERQLNKE